ncbi:MFS transporter [Candidatus Marinamargulisbacteria bacterium SCGC AG-343-D04]|nr:MFS transporter [Candidatus Marinamargulisbacteria bacterium SCGC AG-343-D04]
MASQKTIYSWAFYDWANSAFATTAMAGFFPIFFKQYWNVGVTVNVSTGRLALGTACIGLVLAIGSPIVGYFGDKVNKRKLFLAGFACLGIFSTMALALIGKGLWHYALGVYGFAVLGFSFSNVFYDSLLLHVCDTNKREWVSSLGYAFGYLGGGLLFLFNVFLLLNPSLFGLSSMEEAVQWSFVSVGVWWGVFLLPLLFFVREKKVEMSSLSLFQSLRETFFEGVGSSRLMWFLLSYWLYIDGVHTIIRMAVDYGLSIGFTMNHLLGALLFIQFIGFPAALIFGKIGERWGSKCGLYIGISVYMLITVWGTQLTSIFGFYGIAALIGCTQGGVQALSRAYFSRFIPEGKEGVYFGLYNMVGKYAVIMGPLLIGMINLALAYFSLDPQLISRIGMGSLLLFFVGGICCLRKA